MRKLKLVPFWSVPHTEAKVPAVINRGENVSIPNLKIALVAKGD